MSVLPRTAIVITSIKRGSPEPVSIDADMDDIYGDAGCPRKRRRLNHLSPDEKLLRRKLKNRVAAQTARDRKRVLMDDLELKVAELESENRKLAQENSTLKVQSGRLSQQNKELKGRLCALDRVPVKTELESRSAAGTDSSPVLLGNSLRSITADRGQPDALVSLLQTTSQLPRVDTVQPDSLPGNRCADETKPPHGLVGPTAKELESFNELIQFDHIYFKTAPEVRSGSQNQCVLVNGSESSSVGQVVNAARKTDYKNVKIIITADAKNIREANSKSLLRNIVPIAPTFNASNSQITHFSEDVQINDEDVLADLNFDLLDDLESILSADCEGLTCHTDSLPTQEQDGFQLSTAPKSDKQEAPREAISAIVDTLTATVPSPSKFVSSDSDYLSDTPSPYSVVDAASPLDMASPLGDGMWEESFTELFPDLV